MGLGREFGSDADSTLAVDAELWRTPTVPDVGGGFGSPPPVQTEATRLLSSAAYLRPDSAAELWGGCRRGLRNVLRATLCALRNALLPAFLRRWLDKRRAAKKKPPDDDSAAEVEPPAVVVGHEFARWVRRRVAVGHPVPSFGFELTPVVACCVSAGLLLLIRRAVMILTALVALGCLWTSAPGWSPPALLVAGVWFALYLDRLLAHRRLVAVTRGRSESATSALGRSGRRRNMTNLRQLRFGTVLPYAAETRRSSVRYRFVGAGDPWYEAQIGIDVFPAEHRPGTSEANASFPRLDKLFEAAGNEDHVVRQFTPDELLDHTVRHLSRATRANPDFHPENRLETFGVAAISDQRWQSISRKQWESLLVLAREGPRGAGAPRTPKVARRLLCARVVSWDGEVVASVFVIFALEDNFLRVTLRPQVMNPLHPALQAADRQARASGWVLHSKMWLDSAVDTALLLPRLIIPGLVRKAPETDRNSGPVSLRETYAVRHMDDMFQYDDARRYVQMMQRRVFGAVQNFLVDHNVDTQSYQQQTTFILQNTGVINYGEMGNVQNQPGAAGSTIGDQSN